MNRMKLKLWTLIFVSFLVCNSAWAGPGSGGGCGLTLGPISQTSVAEEYMVTEVIEVLSDGFMLVVLMTSDNQSYEAYIAKKDIRVGPMNIQFVRADKIAWGI